MINGKGLAESLCVCQINFSFHIPVSNDLGTSPLLAHLFYTGFKNKAVLVWKEGTTKEVLGLNLYGLKHIRNVD